MKTLTLTIEVTESQLAGIFEVLGDTREGLKIQEVEHPAKKQLLGTRPCPKCGKMFQRLGKHLPTCTGEIVRAPSTAVQSGQSEPKPDAGIVRKPSAEEADVLDKLHDAPDIRPGDKISVCCKFPIRKEDPSEGEEEGTYCTLCDQKCYWKKA